LGCWFRSPPPAQADVVGIGVRAYVTDASHMWSKDQSKIPGDGGHGKVYAIVAVSCVPSEVKLNQPVDENALLAILVRELDSNGFTRVVKGQRPDLLLAMSYGRGLMTNPYLNDTGEVNLGVDAIPSMTITGAFSIQLVDEKSPGYEQKIQKAGYEKLFIRVTAFNNPKDKSEKAKMLWKTVIVADDPEHMDLNRVASQMLAAGAPLFDKQLRDKALELFAPLPQGHVNVGTPEVVEPTPTPPAKK